jgi:O-acetyl-ADP-ribose deacetylase (regulator of RNase III)
MITEASGSFLDAEADALVNAVNTVGVMGKGVALQFRRAFPDNYEAYREPANAERSPSERCSSSTTGDDSRPEVALPEVA